MFKKILIGLAVVIAVILVLAAFQPNDFKVERSAVISAPAAVVFAQVDNFHNWAAWSPWEKMDPALKRAYEGPAAGKGAIYRWAGNKNVGEGNMTITESHPNDSIQIDLEFIKPFQGSDTTLFTFKPQGSQTNVTWSMSGKVSYVPKIIHLFLNMDKMVGGSFEQGLAQLKAVAEAAPKKK